MDTLPTVLSKMLRSMTMRWVNPTVGEERGETSANVNDDYARYLSQKKFKTKPHICKRNATLATKVMVRSVNSSTVYVKNTSEHFSLREVHFSLHNITIPRRIWSGHTDSLRFLQNHILRCDFRPSEGAMVPAKHEHFSVCMDISHANLPRTTLRTRWT